MSNDKIECRVERRVEYRVECRVECRAYFTVVSFWHIIHIDISTKYERTKGLESKKLFLPVRLFSLSLSWIDAYTTVEKQQ